MNTILAEKPAEEAYAVRYRWAANAFATLPRAIRLKSENAPNNGMNPTCSSMRSSQAGYACRWAGRGDVERSIAKHEGAGRS